VPEPYAVWVSEIMLQQTQVKTVLGYYERFMQRFATAQDLAKVSFDEVAPYWAGLGYYARARNLHKAAKLVAEQGFPGTVAGWQELPGIGRSTAGAIHALGQGGYGPIMDGNVKRVLSRWLAFDQDPKKAAAQKVLWQIAEQLTPKDNSGRYAQALMDLGSIICTRSKPRCTLCPLQADCQAYIEDKTDQFPIKSAPTKFKQRYSIALKITAGDQLLWLKAVSPGIWGELWCLPLIDLPLGVPLEPQKSVPIASLDQNELGLDLASDSSEAFESHPLVQQLISLSSDVHKPEQTLNHRLTHIAWQIQPMSFSLAPGQKDAAMRLLRTFFIYEEKGALKFSELMWMSAEQAIDSGLPKPMVSLIEST
jgi:A/G-specific adenine glycosylase